MLSLKRKISLSVLSLTALAAAVVAACNIWVNRSAHGKVFDDVRQVPAGRVAVVLGTSPESRFGGPNLFYRARIRAAAELYRNGKSRRFVISGARRPGYDETGMMRRDLVAQGVPDSLISEDGAGDRTLLSMRNMRQVYGLDSITVVSQRWHNQRAIFMARHLGIDAVGYNADDVHRRLAKLTHLRELLARVKACAELLMAGSTLSTASAMTPSSPSAARPTAQAQPRARTAGERFAPPQGYRRTVAPAGSFGRFLQELPLRPTGSDLHYYNGSVKEQAYEGAVVDVDFGHGNAEQCADAVIYLRARWLWQTRQYDKIHFNFTSGFRADYSRWARGERIHVNQRTWRCSWSRDARADYSYATFRRYLALVFQYAGTASLEAELRPVDVSQLRIGDVIINGGYPGHTVIIVDEAVNNRGHKVFLLAQGYTPAQEIEIFNRWFDIASAADGLDTPGWYFHAPFARRF